VKSTVFTIIENTTVPYLHDSQRYLGLISIQTNAINQFVVHGVDNDDSWTKFIRCQSCILLPASWTIDDQCWW